MQKPNRVKFVQVYDEDKIIMIVSPDLNIIQLLDKFKEFCLACGYHPNSVNRIKYDEEQDEENT